MNAPKINPQIAIGGAVVLGTAGASANGFWPNKEDSDWEIPKVTVRKGESSVRSVIRLQVSRVE